nr:hypothetical protein [Gemmatimonadota bacterium]
IDGITYIDELLPPGTLADVAVEEVVDDYDFRASLVGVAELPVTARTERVGRSLPMVSGTGSYGR